MSFHGYLINQGIPYDFHGYHVNSLNEMHTYKEQMRECGIAQIFWISHKINLQ